MANEDPLLSATEVAALLSELRGKPIARTTWTGYVSRGQPVDDPAPKPRRRDSVTVRGIASPRWRRSVIIAWNERVSTKKEKPETDAK